MGDFCFTIACDLREDISQRVIDTLKYMTSGQIGLLLEDAGHLARFVNPQHLTDLTTRTDEYEFDNAPDAPFFEDDNWRFLLMCDSRKSRSRFPGVPGSSLNYVYRHMRADYSDVFLYSLSFRCEDKDDGVAYYIEFLEWLAPYSDTQGFIGYLIYEYLEHPTLFYFREGQVYVSDRFTPPREIRTGKEW